MPTAPGRRRHPRTAALQRHPEPEQSPATRPLPGDSELVGRRIDSHHRPAGVSQGDQLHASPTAPDRCTVPVPPPPGPRSAARRPPLTGRWRRRRTVGGLVLAGLLPALQGLQRPGPLAPPLRSADRPKNVPVTRREAVTVHGYPALLGHDPVNTSSRSPGVNPAGSSLRCTPRRTSAAGPRWPAGHQRTTDPRGHDRVDRFSLHRDDVTAVLLTSLPLGQASPRSTEGCSEAQGLGRSGCWVSGRKTRKEAPPPGRSWTQARPPWRLANWVTRARPMPEPGAWSAMLRPWWKG